MKKTAIKLAIITSLSISAGMANADSKVDMYGNIDIGMQYYESDGKDKLSLESGNYNNSVLGFKGKEKISYDLTGKYKLEMGIKADSGDKESNELWNREAYVGLESNKYGEVRLGNNKSPFRSTLESLDPFNGKQAEKIYLGGMQENRVKNSIVYVSPDIKGFKISAIYGFGEQLDNTKTDSTKGLNVEYNINEKLGLKVAYNDKEIGEINSKSMLIGGTYQIDRYELFGTYGTKKEENKETEKTYALGSRISINENQKILASYTLHDNQNVNGDGEQVALGYTLDLSKRTTIYGIYSYHMNEANSNINALAEGKNSKNLTVGINHKF